MAKIIIYDTLDNLEREKMIIDTITKNGKTIEEKLSNPSVPGGQLLSLIQLYGNGKKYAFEAESIDLEHGMDNPFGLGYSSQSFSCIKPLVQGVNEYMQTLNGNPYGLDVVPFFYTFEEGAFKFSLGDKLLAMQWGLFAPLQVKKKALGIIRGSLHGLTAADQIEFKKLY